MLFRFIIIRATKSRGISKDTNDDDDVFSTATKMLMKAQLFNRGATP